MFGLVSKKDYQTIVEQNEKLLSEIDGIKAEFTKVVPHWLAATAETEKWLMPDPSYYENQDNMFRRSSWVASAAENISRVAVPVPFSVKRKVGEEERDIRNHPFELLLDKPNELESRNELLSATYITRIVNGNAYWWLNKPDKYSPPDEIWYIPPNMIIPVPDKKLYIEGYHYYPGTGEEILFEPHEIVHFRRFNPFSRFIGLSAVEAIALIAYGDTEMASWNSRLFRENNGRLPGIITFEQFPPDDVWEVMKSDLTEAARKRNFVMLRGVGQGGIQWLQNAVSQREMEFLEGRAANRAEIWDVLAPGLVSYLSPSSTEANSRTGESAFERLSVFPLLDDIAQKISNEILKLYPGKLVGRFQDIRKIDNAMELEKNKEFAKYHTVGQILEQVFQDPPLGDERDNMTYVELQEWAKAKYAAPDRGGRPSNENQTQSPEYHVTGTQTPANALRRANGEPMQAKIALDELDKFERKAIKKLGKDVEFLSNAIPAPIQDYIHSQLPICRDETSLKATFELARNELLVKPQLELRKEDSLNLANAINNLAEKL